MQSEALLRFAPALAIIALSSCGARSEPANGERPVDSATVTTVQLTSEAFSEGQRIPVQYTCDGADEKPPLSWGEPPAGTKSFALVADDPHAPSGTFRHWGVYDIAPSARSIGGGRKVGSEVTNDFGKPGYGGPCPPAGHGPHHYHFKLLALNIDRLNLGPNAKVIDLEQEAAKHALAQSELVGTYERK